MHGKGGDVQRATQTENPLSGLRHVTHSGINEGAHIAHACDRARDIREPVNGQLDGEHLTGL